MVLKYNTIYLTCCVPAFPPSYHFNQDQDSDWGKKFQPGLGDNLIGGTLEMTLQAASPAGAVPTLVWQPFHTWGTNWGQDIEIFP